MLMERSTKAGARTPATRRRAGTARRGSSTLNEGRGANPGDTPQVHRVRQAVGRSTKAGARTPATRRDLAEVRVMFGDAQRRPGREPRRHRGTAGGQHRRLPRSTKAGARTPATPRVQHVSSPSWRTLNEGRGANPGDTGAGGASTGADTGALNEGRGANPGDTGDGGRSACNVLAAAQRRPGREPRRHSEEEQAAIRAGGAAQRRPGREPRRH